MKKPFRGLLATFAVAAVLSVAAAETFVVGGKHEILNYRLQSSDSVTLPGNHNTLTTTGQGEAISVSGNHNRLLTQESLATCSVSGNHNAIRVESSTAGVNVSGNHNVLIIDGKVRRVHITGKYNNCEVVRLPGRDLPEVIDSGKYNRVIEVGN